MSMRQVRPRLDTVRVPVSAARGAGNQCPGVLGDIGQIEVFEEGAEFCRFRSQLFAILKQIDIKFFVLCFCFCFV